MKQRFFIQIFLYTLLPLWGLGGYAQKQVPLTFYTWELPYVSLAEEATAQTLSIKLFNGQPTVSLKVIYPNTQSNITEDFKTNVTPVNNFLDVGKFNFNTYQLTDSKQADLQLEITAGKPLFIINSIERIYGEFVGNLAFSVPIQINLFNKKGEVVYTRTYTKPLFIDSGNSSPTANQAIESIREKFYTNQFNYTNQARNEFENSLVIDCVKALLQDLDYRRSKTKKVNFYTLKNKDDFDATENNRLIENTLRPLSVLEDSADYLSKLKDGLRPCIAYWEKEAVKYDTKDKDKNIRKIAWAFYTQLSAAYYVMDDFDKAIMYADKAKETEINKGDNYILDYPKEELKKIQVHTENGKLRREYTQYHFLQSNNTQTISIVPYK